MCDFERLYERFEISSEKGDSLRRLAESPLHRPRPTARVVVETVIVENGERRIVETEEQNAKLV